MSKNGVDPLLAVILDLSDEPTPALNGTGTDTDVHPVENLWHQARYGIAAPGSTPAAAPVKKSLTIDEIEKQLAERRRKTLIEKSVALLAGARPLIRQAIVQDAIEDFPQHAHNLRLLQ